MNRIKELLKEKGMSQKELAEKRCHLLDCPDRQPPTDRSLRARKKAASATTAKEKQKTPKP